MPRSITDEMRRQIHEQLTARPKPAENPARKRTAWSLYSKPFLSDALGVSPDDIPTAMALLRSNGVTADFMPDGRLIATSEKQFREAARAFGIYSGARGFEARDEDGNKIRTGRESVEIREQRKRELERQFREYGIN